MHQPVALRLPVLVFAALAALFAPGRAAAQIDAGYLAKVEDRKISVAYLSAEDATDVSLALVPPSFDGAAGVTLILRARFTGRTSDAARLREIALRAHYRVLSDDRRRATRALADSHQLRVDLGFVGARGISLSFFPTTWGYGGFTAPGDEIPMAGFTVAPAELRALAAADSLSGHVLWTDFALADGQIAALREFASRVLPQR